jgi:hypothetical protein
MIMAIVAIGPRPPPRSRDPPKNIAKLPSIAMAPAIVAVIVMISVSRFFTCASSCAITPATSSGDSWVSSPVVAATAAFCGLRPVAKALGCGLSMMKTFGIGRLACLASLSTRP